MNLALIERRFRRAGTTYAAQAVAQKKLADTLATGLADIQTNFGRALELGCGVLTFSRGLVGHCHIDELWLNDLMEPSLGNFFTAGKVYTLAGNAEELVWPENLDLIAASSVVQWFHAPLRVLERASEAAAPGALLALGLFLPGTFAEFSSVTQLGLDYPDVHAWDLAAHTAGWSTVFDQAVDLTLRFDNPIEVLRHIQATGVGGCAEMTWTRSSLAELVQNYPRDENQTCPLSYRGRAWVLKRNF